jgi:hypothetical protein
MITEDFVPARGTKSSVIMSEALSRAMGHPVVQELLLKEATVGQDVVTDDRSAVLSRRTT